MKIDNNCPRDKIHVDNKQHALNRNMFAWLRL